jgi:two-component system chemotaxis response regulator CheB
VLIVDDSVVIRRLVTHALSEDPAIEVVGSAANGVIALAKIPQVNPDVITLDIEMPEMDGLTFLKHVRKTYPRIRIIMFSTLTRRGTTATIDALMLGADDYVSKAANVGSLSESMETLRKELVPKITQFIQQAPASPPARPQPAAAWGTHAGQPALAPRLLHGRPQIVAIGVSTGGPTALAAVIPMLPSDLRVPIVIVQHMPPMFTQFLADRLQKQTTLQVREATEGSSLAAGTILIAPGDFHMRVRRNGDAVVITLNQDPPENSCRPAVDVLFRSVAEVFGGKSIGVVMTGMGQDGLRGAESLRASGGYIIAQDEASSVVWGMPGAVVRAKLADAVVSLANIAPEVLRHL